MDVKFRECQRPEQLTRETATELGLPIEVEHVREAGKIMGCPVLSTPALVVDRKVQVSGRMPSKAELAGWLRGQ